MGDAERAIEPEEPGTTPEPESDTAGHNTVAIQLGWDIPAERRRQAERAARDDRPHVRTRRDLLGRLRRK